MPIFDTQLHPLSILPQFLAPVSIVLGISLLFAISNFTPRRVLAAISNRRGTQPPLFVVALAGGRLDYWDIKVRFPSVSQLNFDFYAILSALPPCLGPQRDNDSESAQSSEKVALPLTPEDEILVSSPCMPLARPLARRTPDLTAQLDAAKEALASMTSMMAVLAEQKDEALTRANTLQNVKESWVVRERALVSTIKSLKTSSSNKFPGDVAGLRHRLQETESMLAHQIHMSADLEDQLARSREIARSQQQELYALRKETSKQFHEQAIEIATLKGQLLAMRERERQLTPPAKTRKTFRFWRKKRVVTVDLGISSSSGSSSAFNYY